MIPQFPNFVALSGSHENIINNFTKNEPYSDFNFTSLYTWNTKNDSYLSIINDNLVLKLNDYIIDKHFLTFIGKNELNYTAETLLTYAADSSINSTLEIIPESVAQHLDNNVFLIKEDRSNHDYIFTPSTYTSLLGGEFRNIRKKINRFDNNYAGKISIQNLKSLSQNDRHDIEELISQWREGDSDGVISSENEILSIQRAFTVFSDTTLNIPLECFTLRIDEKLVGFCMYEIVNNSWAITHFGKSDHTRKDSYTYMMVRLLSQLNKRNIKYVNNEQDLGIDGLRDSKMSLKPQSFLKKYSIALRQ